MIKCLYVGAQLGAIAVSAAPYAAPYISSRQEGTAELGVRAAAILEAFQHSWKGYADNAFGADEVDTIDGSRSYGRYITPWSIIAVCS